MTRWILRFWTVVLIILPAACGDPHDAPPPSTAVTTSAVIGPVGAWTVDVEAFEASFLRMLDRELAAKKRREQLSQETVAGLWKETRRQVRDRFASAWGRFVFEDDRTFHGEGSDGLHRGRWKLEGMNLSMTLTHESGVEQADPDVWHGTWRKGTITLCPEPDRDYEMVLRREE